MNCEDELADRLRYRVESSPYRKTYLNHKNEFHRDGGPAIEWADGSRLWYRDGKRHRDDGPAVEWAVGDQEWWVNGVLHREDGPAIERFDGSRKWYLNGIQQRKPQGCIS